MTNVNKNQLIEKYPNIIIENRDHEERSQYLYCYYKYLREEIAREDGITNQRMTWLMTIQGFLISAVALLIVFTWPKSGDFVYIVTFRLFVLGAICILGFVMAWSSRKGISASHTSLNHVKKTWETILSKNGCVYDEKGRKFIPDIYPQAYYDVKYYDSESKEKDYGVEYAKRIPLVFLWMWGIFIIVYFIVVFPILWEKIEFSSKWDQVLTRMESNWVRPTSIPHVICPRRQKQVGETP